MAPHNSHWLLLVHKYKSQYSIAWGLFSLGLVKLTFSPVTILYCQGFRHLVGVVFDQNSQNARKVALTEKLPASFTKVEVSPVLAGLISNLINLMNATNPQKPEFFNWFSLEPNVSQDLGYNTETNTTSGLLAVHFFLVEEQITNIIRKKISYFPYVTCITTPPSTKPPPLFEQQCGIF